MLLDHDDEVWHLQFSHSGGRLASAAKSGVAIVWDVCRASHRVVKRHALCGHEGAVVVVAWSPDDSRLATCGAPAAAAQALCPSSNQHSMTRTAHPSANLTADPGGRFSKPPSSGSAAFDHAACDRDAETRSCLTLAMLASVVSVSA